MVKRLERGEMGPDPVNIGKMERVAKGLEYPPASNDI